MNIKDWFKYKVLRMTGMIKQEEAPNDRLTFINDNDRITKLRVQEYDVWYYGESDELLNFYTGQTMWEYAYEPIYSRNKKNYFWSISSTEGDIKRTHSGQARNVIDTLVAICPFPLIRGGKLEDEKSITNKNLYNIIKESGLKEIYRNEQLPLTLVEGWGCYKIIWDKDISDYPRVVYYRAENVDFVYKLGKVIGIIFKDYYVDKDGKKYMLTETRRFGRNSLGERCLFIENELFQHNNDEGEYVTKVDLHSIPEMQGVEERIVIKNMNSLFAVPTIIFRNTSSAGGYGRSIFTGKIDLFDDLDQCLSQASNTVRRSTVVEYFNSDFLERDPRTGLTKQPKAYDRKYSVYKGQKDANGSSTSASPVEVTQPQVNFEQYSNHAVQILMQIIDGIMSPATLGIDIAKKDNAEAQREKEKVTIFTRNLIISSEIEILQAVCSQLLAAYEFMSTGSITVQDYDISVRFSEFADESYENKLKILGDAYDSENISDKMFMKKLYGDSLTDAEYTEELEWLKEHHTKPRDDGMKGIAGGGKNSEGLMSNMLGGGAEQAVPGQDEGDDFGDI